MSRSQTDPSGLSLVDEVHARLREAILTGEYSAGSRLVASTIAHNLSVSPIPVREALRRLESERLVLVEQNRGATVTGVSLEGLKDVYETRVGIECGALRRGFANLDGTRINQLQRELEVMTEAFGEQRWRDGHRHHQNFHFLLYEPAHSEWTMHLIGQLWGGVERYLLVAPIGMTADDYLVDHTALLDAVRTGDVEVAVGELESHLRKWAARMTQSFSPSV